MLTWKKMRTIVAMLFCALALSAAEPGQRAPGFALMDSKGDLHDLYDYRGKPVIVEFMQTTCPHCASFASTLERVQAKYGNKIGIVSIANPPDNPNSVNAFIKGHFINYPVLFDMGQAAYSYIRKQQFDLPQVYLIDANGIIFNRYGYSALTKDIFEGNGLMNEIDRMLGSAAPPPAAAAKPASAKKK
jgi:peroxiredoxin